MNYFISFYVPLTIPVSIFLSRTANIWLQSSERRDKFILSGCSDYTMFEKSKREADNQIAFLFREHSTTTSDASKHFLQAFAKHYDERGIVINRGKLHINSPDLFKVGRFYPDTSSKTSYHINATEQGVFRLYDDWVTEDQTGKRRTLFKDRHFREVMAFPLTQRRTDATTSETEVIGFASLHNDRFSNFSQAWCPTIRLVNDQIVIALEQIGFIKEEDALIRKAMLHETKEQAAFLVGQVENFQKRANYARHELNDILRNNAEFPDGLAARLLHLKKTYNLMEGDLGAVKKSYRNLHLKLEHAGKASIYAFLGVNPDDEDIDEMVAMDDMLYEVVKGYKQIINNKGIIWNFDVRPNTNWRGHKESIRRILQNLLDNASKYALKDTTIDIVVNNTQLQIKNQCDYDDSLQGSWPFSPGKRGLVLRKKIPGWGYGLCAVQLFCEMILKWRCEFEQIREPSSPSKATFSITIIRKL
jgi:hypothetical protein